MKVVEQLLDVGVPIEIDGGVGMTVARQELLDAQACRRMSRPERARRLRIRAQSTPLGAG